MTSELWRIQLTLKWSALQFVLCSYLPYLWCIMHTLTHMRRVYLYKYLVLYAIKYIMPKLESIVGLRESVANDMQVHHMWTLYWNYRAYYRAIVKCVKHSIAQCNRNSNGKFIMKYIVCQSDWFKGNLRIITNVSGKYCRYLHNSKNVTRLNLVVYFNVSNTGGRKRDKERERKRVEV